MKKRTSLLRNLTERLGHADTWLDRQFIRIVARFSPSAVVRKLNETYPPGGYDPAYQALHGKMVLTSAEKRMAECYDGTPAQDRYARTLKQDSNTGLITEIIIRDTHKPDSPVIYEETITYLDDGSKKIERSFNGMPLSTYSFAEQDDICRVVAEYINLPREQRKDHFNCKLITDLVAALADPEQEYAQDYLRKAITWLAAFLGLPTHLADLAQGQSWDNIGYQFLGWSEHRSDLANVFTMMFLIPFHFATIFPALALNVLKLVTEVLPYYVQAASGAIATLAARIVLAQLQNLFRGGSWEEVSLKLLSLPITLGIVGISVTVALACSAIYVGAGLAHYIGCAVTSPIRSVRIDWKYWHDYYPQMHILARLFFTSLRVLTAAVVYGLAVAFAAPYVATLAAPFIAAHTPLWLVLAHHGLMAATVVATHILINWVPAISLVSTLAVETFALTAGLVASVVVLGSLLWGFISKIADYLHGVGAKPRNEAVSADANVGKSRSSASQVLHTLQSEPAAPVLLIVKESRTAEDLEVIKKRVAEGDFAEQANALVQKVRALVPRAQRLADEEKDPYCVKTRKRQADDVAGLARHAETAVQIIQQAAQEIAQSTPISASTTVDDAYLAAVAAEERMAAAFLSLKQVHDRANYLVSTLTPQEGSNVRLRMTTR